MCMYGLYQEEMAGEDRQTIHFPKVFTLRRPCQSDLYQDVKQCQQSLPCTDCHAWSSF